MLLWPFRYPPPPSEGNAAVLPLSSFDLCRIFTNITNNALEANEKLDSNAKFIRITTSAADSWYTIACVNSFNGVVNMVNGELRTTKEDAFSHGFGLKNIEEIANTYGGFTNIEADAESGIFKIYIHIPLCHAAAADLPQQKEATLR